MTEENIQMIYDMCADRIRETDTVAAYRYGCSDSCISIVREKCKIILAY